MNHRLGEIQLIISVLFFGASFVGMKYAMNRGIKPLTFNAGRFVVSSLLLFASKPFLQKVLRSHHNDAKSESHCNRGKYDEIVSEDETINVDRKNLWWYGFLCGISNSVGSILQQVSLLSISVAKSGFITGMYVVVVPLVESAIPGHKSSVSIHSIIAALVSLIGMYFLSGCSLGSSSCFDASSGRGEIIALFGMLCWAIFIMVADYGSKKVDCIELTCVNFLISIVVSMLVALYFEPEEWKYPFTNIINNWFPIAIVGFTEALAFLLSTLGQMYTPPSRAALLLSLEAVSSALGGYLVLHELLSPVEIFGCLLMFGATLVATIEFSCFRTSENTSVTTRNAEKSPLISSNPNITTAVELINPSQHSDYYQWNELDSASKMTVVEVHRDLRDIELAPMTVQ